MNNKKNVILTAVWGILSLAVLGFIFSNSVRNGEESALQSQWYVDIFISIFDPMQSLEYDVWVTIVRKLAHFTEFFALGLCIKFFIGHVCTAIEKSCLLLPFFITLLCAVSDEFIQSFTGRTSSARDVLIDFAGSITGILIAALLMKIGKNKTKYVNIQK